MTRTNQSAAPSASSEPLCGVPRPRRHRFRDRTFSRCNSSRARQNCRQAAWVACSATPGRPHGSELSRPRTLPERSGGFSRRADPRRQFRPTAYYR